MTAYTAKKRHGKKKPIGRRSHRVVLCTAKDYVDKDGSMRLRREVAIRPWASIEEKRGQLFTAEGRPFGEQRDQQSHIIIVRLIERTEISSAAWIYEDRGTLMSPRWFKILTVLETEEQGNRGTDWSFSCRQVERSDDASKPAEPVTTSNPNPVQVASLPAGIKL